MTPTVAALLAEARAQGVDRLDALLLLAHASGRTRTWLIAHDDAALPPAEAQAFTGLAARRARGEPFAYLVGEREFHGLVLQVTPDVLVPRPDTEILVDWALALLAPGGPLDGVAAPSVLDLGTGSGAIALAVRHRCPRSRVHALDASPAALAVARGNAEHLGLPVDFRAGDWWDGWSGGPLDLALGNPPYIAAGDPHLAALVHEPLVALTPGGDGLGAYDRLVGPALAHLKPGGWLLLEHGHDQGAAVRERLQAAGYAAVETRRDLAGLERCSGGCRPGG